MDDGLDERQGRTWVLVGVRYVLPALVVLAGLVIMSLGSEVDLEGGASILSAGLAIYFINWLFRIGVAGDREREREDAAREYFTLHGRWPEL
ncbi:MAG: hypothetical protein ACYDHN_10160 [Solirubrobacteraceae bacterium]